MKKSNIVDQTKLKIVRGKYTNLIEQGSNIAILDHDIVDHFPDSESVNNALRTFIAMSEQFALLTDSAQRPSRRLAARKRRLAFDPRIGIIQSNATAAK